MLVAVSLKESTIALSVSVYLLWQFQGLAHTIGETHRSLYDLWKILQPHVPVL